MFPNGWTPPIKCPSNSKAQIFLPVTCHSLNAGLWRRSRSIFLMGKTVLFKKRACWRRKINYFLECTSMCSLSLTSTDTHAQTHTHTHTSVLNCKVSSAALSLECKCILMAHHSLCHCHSLPLIPQPLNSLSASACSHCWDLQLCLLNQVKEELGLIPLREKVSWGGGNDCLHFAKKQIRGRLMQKKKGHSRLKISWCWRPCSLASIKWQTGNWKQRFLIIDGVKDCLNLSPH